MHHDNPSREPYAAARSPSGRAWSGISFPSPEPSLVRELWGPCRRGAAGRSPVRAAFSVQGPKLGVRSKCVRASTRRCAEIRYRNPSAPERPARSIKPIGLSKAGGPRVRSQRAISSSASSSFPFHVERPKAIALRPVLFPHSTKPQSRSLLPLLFLSSA